MLNFHHSFIHPPKYIYHVGVFIPTHPSSQVPPTIANLDLSPKVFFFSFFHSFFLSLLFPSSYTKQKKKVFIHQFPPLFSLWNLFCLLKRFNGLDFVDDFRVMICAFWSNELTMDPPEKHPLVGWVHSINSKELGIYILCNSFRREEAWGLRGVKLKSKDYLSSY
jgi:hypothetical protein